jgi:hypothetical protein
MSNRCRPNVVPADCRPLANDNLGNARLSRLDPPTRATEAHHLTCHAGRETGVNDPSRDPALTAWRSSRGALSSRASRQHTAWREGVHGFATLIEGCPFDLNDSLWLCFRRLLLR